MGSKVALRISAKASRHPAPGYVPQEQTLCTNVDEPESGDDAEFIKKSFARGMLDSALASKIRP